MLKLRGSGLMLASGVWLAIYVVCVLVVASFIFFEVLDVDGSDFPIHPTKPAARVAEPQHDDLKRMWMHGPVGIWRGVGFLEIRQPERRDRDMPAVAPRPRPLREPRVALPRAALSDTPSPA